jgi:hypothetical protein
MAQGKLHQRRPHGNQAPKGRAGSDLKGTLGT